MYSKKRLKNGLKIILSPLKETKAVTVLVLVKVGSRYESKEINGASHFVEHMMFKGTKKRPNTLAISKELDGIGANYNAFTAKDHTGYYIKTSSDKVELAFDVLADMIFNSLYDRAEILKERQVIIEEINMYEDNPMMYAPDLFEQTVFGPQNGLGQIISGPKRVIAGMTRQKLMSYMNKFYDPKNMVISVAGNFRKSDILKLVEKHFDSKSQKKSFPKYKKTKIDQKSPRLKLHFKKTEQVQLCLGFPAYSYFDKDLYILYLLAIILGGNMSSRLFIKIREKLGLAYLIQASSNVYEDTGNFMIQAGLARTKIQKAVQEILKELKRVKEKGVTDEELKKAKEFLRGKLILELENSSSIADWYGKQEILTGKLLTPEQKNKLIKKVTLKDIKRVAKEVFQLKKLNVALIGPFRDKAKLFPKKTFSDI